MLLNRTQEPSLPPDTHACRKLVQDIKDRNISALEALYDKYAALIYGKLVAELGDRQLAESICTAVFVRTWHEIDGYEQGKCRLFTWLLQLARKETRARFPE